MKTSTDVETIKTFLTTITRPGDVFEVRAVNCCEAGREKYKFTTSGFYETAHIDEAADAIAKLDESAIAPGIYITLNPVNPSLLALAANRIKSRVKVTTSDADIVSRRWLLIDCDPVRKSNISASDFELKLAEIRAEEIETYLDGLGWPKPMIKAMSGNGYHLLYRVELPTGDDGLLQRVLETLSNRFGGIEVAVDKSVHNPARISKIIGTTSRKGDVIAERPHRKSSLLFLGPDIVVTREQLGFLAPPKAIVKRSTMQGERKFPATASDVAAWLQSHGVEVRGIRPQGDKTMILLARCPINPEVVSEHGSDIGVLVGNDGKLAYCNMHNRGQGLTWKDLRLKLDPTYTPGAYGPADDDDANFGNWGDPTISKNNGHVLSEIKRVSRETASRKRISNVTVVRGQEDEKLYVANDIWDIGGELRGATDGEPRVIQGALFALGEYDRGNIPCGRALRFLKDDAALFAWMKERVNVDWPTSFAKKRPVTPDRSSTTSVVKARELYEHLRQASPNDYIAVDVLPHQPTVPGIFYVPFAMPEGNGACLAEWVERFNGETDEDYDLFTAALLTPAWGGPCGARPAFVFSSAHGRGSGKTKTAERIGDIYGGRTYISASPKMDWDKAKSGLVGDSALASRCVIIDNIKNKLSGSELEGLITSPYIEGHKMYHGRFSRPNRLTFFLTANTPSLSQDLADRSVMIHVGAQKHGSDWEEWSLRFLQDNRLALLADIYTALQGPQQCVIAVENRDRWATWQNAILARMPNGNELAAMIKARRPEVDSDSEDAGEIREAIEAEITECGHSLAVQNIKISNDRMRRLLMDRGIIDKTFNIRGITTYLSNLLGTSGQLANLKKDASRKGGRRGWVYFGIGGDFERVELRNRPWGDTGDARGTV